MYYNFLIVFAAITVVLIVVSVCVFAAEISKTKTFNQLNK